MAGIRPISHKHQLLLRNFLKKSGWSLEIYIHLYHCHQNGKLHNCKRKSGLYIETLIHIYHHHYYDKLHNCKINIGCYQDSYVPVFHHPKILQNFHHEKYHHRYNGGRNNFLYLDTNIQDFHHHSLQNYLIRWLVFPVFLLLSMVSGNELFQYLGLNCVSFQVLMV